MRKQKRGDALNIAAHDWNRLVDVANAGRIGQTGGDSRKNGDVFVTVKNGLGRDLMRYAAVCIGYPTALHTGQNDMIFPLYKSSLRGQDADSANNPVLGILQEPIANGRWGVAQIAGVTPAQFSHYDTPSENPGPFAVMSDLDDKLAMSDFGPIQVLQRNFTLASGNGADDRYFMVKIATPVSLGAVNFHFTPTAWDASPNFNYAGMVFDAQTGDARHVGVFGDSETLGEPVGRLYLGRLGRYVVTVNWAASPSALSFVANDRLECRVSWISQTNPALTEAEYHSFSPFGWGQSAGLQVSESLSGERSFFFNVTSTPVQIPMPGITFRKVLASGSAASTPTTNGYGRIRVVRIGGSPHNALWTNAEYVTAWARSSSAGPVV